jgi:hypothetical protein
MAATAAMAAAPLPVHAAPQRAPAPVSAEAEEVGGSPILLIAIIAVVLGALIFALSDGEPESP